MGLGLMQPNSLGGELISQALFPSLLCISLPITSVWYLQLPRAWQGHPHCPGEMLLFLAQKDRPPG